MRALVKSEAIFISAEYLRMSPAQQEITWQQ